jgi:hypothetical protein
MRTPPQVVERLATEGLLDHATCLRCIHLGRFFERIGKLGVERGVAKVRDAVTDEEAQVIWRETADPRASHAEIGHHPLIYRLAWIP